MPAATTKFLFGKFYVEHRFYPFQAIWLILRKVLYRTVYLGKPKTRAVIAIRIEFLPHYSVLCCATYSVMYNTVWCTYSVWQICPQANRSSKILFELQWLLRVVYSNFLGTSCEFLVYKNILRIWQCESCWLYRNMSSLGDCNFIQKSHRILCLMFYRRNYIFRL